MVYREWKNHWISKSKKFLLDVKVAQSLPKPLGDYLNG